MDLTAPLLSLFENQAAELGAELLCIRKITFLGARKAGLIAGWVAAGDLVGGTLGEHMRATGREDVLEESASLTITDQVFLEWLGEVGGAITRRNLQKAPLQMTIQPGTNLPKNDPP
jgi:hypothetical protein